MKKYILGVVFSIGLLVSPAFTQAAALTTVQATSLIELVKSSPSTPASAFVDVITEFSKITQAQATSLIVLIQASPSTPTSHFVDVITSFTDDTALTAPTVTSSFSPSNISPTGSTVYSYSSKNTTHCVTTHPGQTGGWDNIITNASFPPTTYTAAQFPNGLTTTITCYNAAGQSAVSTAVLTVMNPTVTSFFSPSTISSTGSSVYQYDSQNTTHCVSSHPDGTGTWDNVTPNASFPPTTYTAASYPNGLTTTITCYNAAGQPAVSTAVLTVQPAPVPAPTVTSSFSPFSISSTGSTVYSYSSNNTTHCVTSHPDNTGGWDNVTPNASFSGTYTASQFPDGLTTTQTCYNSAGQSAVSTAAVTVTAAPTIISSFSPSTISPTGSTVYSYSSNNTTRCVTTHPDGTGGWANVTPNASFSGTYYASQFPNGLTTTQTCYNVAGQSAVSTQTLTVTN